MKHFRIDISCFEGTNAYCSAENLPRIREAAGRIPLRAVHNIGNGNYHYLTLFFLERIHRDFALVYFDHHPDNQEDAFSSGMLSCGNWVARASESLERLKAVSWTGGPGEPAPVPEGLPVYISIDLDILSPEFIRTVWDQGAMTPAELTLSLRSIISDREILGIDICGASDESDDVVQNLYSLFAEL